MEKQLIIGSFTNNTGLFMLSGTPEHFEIFLLDKPLNNQEVKTLGYEKAILNAEPISLAGRLNYFYRMGLSWSKLSKDRQKRVSTVGYVHKTFSSNTLSLLELAESIENSLDYAMCLRIFKHAKKLAGLLDVQVAAVIKDLYR